jgi:oxygen-independent coproporphyrinogen-3 oxidase
MSIPLAVYVHLPWCVRKCPYCDFNSHATPRSLPESEYVSALLADLAADTATVAGYEVQSVFFGGGTPSLFAPRSIGTVLDAIADALPLAPQPEVTLEANPGTVEHGAFAGYAAAGVNRVSLGAQSFDVGQLGALGRIHSPRDIVSAVDELGRAGIDNFNLDLMYALPGQSVAGALDDVAAAIALGPAHLSHYQLTLEPGTAFYHQRPSLPDDDTALAMQLACQERITLAGFDQYEVSAYARDGRRCHHNLQYWHYGDYLGLGAGAHGKLTAADGIWRSEKARLPRDYMARAIAGDAGERHRVTPAELPFEWALNSLRLTDGASLAAFEATTGLPATRLRPTLEALAARGLVGLDGDRLKPTELGFRFLNDVQAAFLPERAA